MITAEVRKAHSLTGDDFGEKQVNDSALAKIIKGEDDASSLELLDHVRQIMKKLYLTMLIAYLSCKRKSRIRFSLLCDVYTAKPRTNGDGYKGLVHQPDSEGATDL